MEGDENRPLKSILILFHPTVNSCFIWLEGIAKLVVVCEEKLRCGQVEALGCANLYSLVGKGADYKNLFLIVLAGVGINLAGELVMLLIIAVANRGEALTKLDSVAVEVKNGMLVALLICNVDFLVVLVYVEPRCTGGEACVFLC